MGNRIGDQEVPFDGEELLDGGGPVRLRDGGTMTIAEFAEEVRNYVGVVMDMGLPPVEMVQRLCDRAGIDIQRVQLELAVIKLVVEYWERVARAPSAGIGGRH